MVFGCFIVALDLRQNKMLGRDSCALLSRTTEIRTICAADALKVAYR